MRNDRLPFRPCFRRPTLACFRSFGTRAAADSGDERQVGVVVRRRMRRPVPVNHGWPLADDRVKQVKEASDIVDVVGSYLALRPAGQTFKGLCPFHEDSRPSFDVDPRRQRYRCWACNKVGDVFSFVQEFEKVGFREALELLARRAGIELDAKEVRPDGRASLLGVMRWATKRFHECLLDDPLAHGARLYVGERGLSGLTV